MPFSGIVKLALVGAIAVLASAVSPAAAELCITSGNCSESPLGGKRYCKHAKILVIEFFVGTCSVRGVCTMERDCKEPAECRLGTCQVPPSNCGPEEDCPGS